MYREHAPGLPFPVELGAELVHGGSDAFRRMVTAAGAVELDVASSMYVAERGGIRPGEGALWGAVERFIDALRAEDGHADRSVAKALEEIAERDPAVREGREMVLSYVRGFHAADPGRMSARGLVVSEGDQGTAGGENRRVLGGFGRVLDWLASALDPARDRLLLRTVAKRVRWSAGRVTIDTEVDGEARERIEGAAAIVTVPLGVLQAPEDAPGAIRFEPGIDDVREALDRLAFGHAVKVALRFDASFWERQRSAAGETLGDLAFLSVPDTPLAVWWTQLPVRAPLLIGWAGGEEAHGLAGRSRGAMQDLALEVLARAFDRSPSSLRRALVSFHHHDWSRDPFARGAYSWVPLGGVEAARVLERPVEDTLFFAGEATHAHGDFGTVPGAIETGVRAARDVLAALEGH